MDTQQKYVLALSLFFCVPVWAALGEPLTYTLPVPPNDFAVDETPFSLPIPPRPDASPSDKMNAATGLQLQLDSLRPPQKKKVKIRNSDGVKGLPVRCDYEMKNTFCQANTLHVMSDRGEFIQRHLERLSPKSYLIVSDFVDYFYLEIQGTTPCKLDVSCTYLKTQ